MSEDLNKPNKTEQPIEPLEFPKMDANTNLIVNACRQVVQSAEDYESETMTTPKTVVQSICELDTLFDNIRSYNKEEKANKD